MRSALPSSFNDDHTIDVEGVDFSDLGSARAFAIKSAREIMTDELKEKGRINLSHWIEIEDEEREMHPVIFADALKIRDTA